MYACLALRLADLADDEPDDGDNPEEEGQLVHAGEECGVGRQDVGDVAVADGVEESCRGC